MNRISILLHSPLEVMLTRLLGARLFLNEGFGVRALAEVREYRRLRRGRFIPRREAAVVECLDRAALLLGVAADLCRQDEEFLAGGVFRAASRILDQAGQLIDG
jgi:hypothetical protein